MPNIMPLHNWKEIIRVKGFGKSADSRYQDVNLPRRAVYDT